MTSPLSIVGSGALVLPHHADFVPTALSFLSDWRRC
jgi:hypothetical protein